MRWLVKDPCKGREPVARSDSATPVGVVVSIGDGSEADRKKVYPRNRDAGHAVLKGSVASGPRLMRQLPWLKTLVAYGLAQSALALSAFIKVPLIIGAGGNAAYAAVTLILSAWAITAALADGLGQTSRVMLAERGIGQSERVRRLVGGAASGEALVMTLVAVVGFVVLLAIGHSTELWLLYFGFAIVCLPVSYAKGILEASDRTALSNATLATNVVVSLPLVALAAYFSGEEVWLCAATLGGVAAPFLVFAYLVRTPGLRILYRPRTTRQTMSTVFSTTVYSFANVMAYAFDPIIIAVFLTSRDVSAFGLASRIMTLAMLLPLALGGLISARVNSWREQTAPGDSYRRIRRLCLQMGAAGAIVSALAVAIGPVSVSGLDVESSRHHSHCIWPLVLMPLSRARPLLYSRFSAARE